MRDGRVWVDVLMPTGEQQKHPLADGEIERLASLQPEGAIPVEVCGVTRRSSITYTAEIWADAIIEEDGSYYLVKRNPKHAHADD